MSVSFPGNHFVLSPTWRLPDVATNPLLAHRRPFPPHSYKAGMDLHCESVTAQPGCVLLNQRASSPPLSNHPFVKFLALELPCPYGVRCFVACTCASSRLCAKSNVSACSHRIGIGRGRTCKECDTRKRRVDYPESSDRERVCTRDGCSLSSILREIEVALSGFYPASPRESDDLQRCVGSV